MHYFLSRCANRLEIGTLNLPLVSSNAVQFGAVPIDGNQMGIGNSRFRTVS